MAKDAIDFKNDKVSTLYRRLLIPTLLGTLSLSAMTAIDGIFVGHGVGSDGVAAVNIVAPVYQVFSGIGLMLKSGQNEFDASFALLHGVDRYDMRGCHAVSGVFCAFAGFFGHIASTGKRLFVLDNAQLHFSDVELYRPVYYPP